MSFQKTEIDLQHCTGCVVVGFLYDSDDFADLGQDMIEVRIPGGIKINAGWYPEGSPDGCYRIRTWGTKELPDVATTNVDEAAQWIREIVEMFIGEGPHAFSDACTTVSPKGRDYQIA